MTTLIHNISSSSEPYRGRFAPSPTGPLHFGSLVAAVGSYLDAKSNNGQWLIRIDDIDPPREIPGIIPQQLQTLENLGFEWDEEILYQSKRQEAYADATATLLKAKLAFTCSCSRKQISSAGIKGVEGWVYPGTCRENKIPNDLELAVRFNTDNLSVSFEDAIQGEVNDDLGRDFGDFLIRRMGQLYSYQLVTVIDDAYQNINSVVRGVDLLSSTSRQIALQSALDLPYVKYMHLPIAVHTSGDKLSKQNHASALDPQIAAGNATALLLQALDFLEQSPPKELIHEDLKSIWQWSIEHWSASPLLGCNQKTVQDQLDAAS